LQGKRLFLRGYTSIADEHRGVCRLEDG
jgi:hypothetical protein